MVIEPPHKTAVVSSTGDAQRDHLSMTLRTRDALLASAMKARALPWQKTEAWFSASALSRMTNLGMLVSVKA
jgi:hypothetical protein